MEDLPAHIMIDILSRLPVKTIIHCKTVCKNWQNLVSESYFVNLHLSRSLAGLIIHHDSEKAITGNHEPGILKWVEIEDELDHPRLHHNPVMSLDLSLADVFKNSHILPVGSVNGLICLWQFGPEADNTYICNPITREYTILPRQKYYREGHAMIIYGFGVSSLTGEYKVIRTFIGGIPPNPSASSRPSRLEAEVYTLGTGQWRSLGHIPYWLDGFQGPFLNGHCHWCVCNQDSPENLCTFDLDKETFQLFPSPPSEAGESRIHFQSLAVLKGCLCLFDTCNSRTTIWVMKEYRIKKSWQKEVVIRQSVKRDLDWLMEDGSIYEDKPLANHTQNKTIKDMEVFDPYLDGLPYRPTFLALHNIEPERTHKF